MPNERSLADTRTLSSSFRITLSLVNLSIWLRRMSAERAAVTAEPTSNYATGLEPSGAAVACAIIAAVAVSVYAALAWRSLFADGFLYFTEMLVDRGFVLTEPARRTVHVLQQFPTVLALHLGVTGLGTLVFIYGLTLQMLPLVLTAACYLVLPRAEKAFFLFPLTHYLLGVMPAAFVPVVEGPVAAAYFWLLLFLILFGRTRVALLATVCLAAPALFLHETTVLLMPLLAIAAGMRAPKETTRTMRALFWMLAGWFMVITLVQVGYIIHPRSEERRLNVLMTARSLFGIGNLNGANVPALMAIAAILTAIAVYRREAKARPSWRIVQAFMAWNGVLLALTLVRGMSGRLFVPGAQFSARNLAVIVSMPLAALALAMVRRGGHPARFLSRQIGAIIVSLAVGQAAWHAIGIHYWSLFTEDFRTLLMSHSGYLAWRDAISNLPVEQTLRLRRIDWPWTNALMSIVLSPGGRVQTIIGPLNENGWVPFDARQPSQLPQAPQFDYSRYLQALSDPNSSRQPGRD